MKIQRGDRSTGWTGIRNKILEDGNLRLASRGLLAYLISRPPGWETDSTTLARGPHARREGREAIQGLLRDLEQHGYLTRARVQNEQGHWAIVAQFWEIPVPASSRTSLTWNKNRPQPVDNTVDSLVDDL